MVRVGDSRSESPMVGWVTMRFQTKIHTNKTVLRTNSKRTGWGGGGGPL